ncbi:hypothetical protein [Halonotius aquaticus]|uniref:hypothetical protein n=1 Tax=Halonotius aquaticus TaxID=2216978 RepID=UPI00105855FD|nr:hypothetical protein [Halonotius aquaticus]
MTAGDIIDGLLAKKSISLIISFLIPLLLGGVLLGIPALGPELSIIPPVLIGVLVSWMLGSAYGKRKIYRKVGNKR